MKLVFVTGNKYKYRIARKALSDLNIRLVQKKIPVPEIQSMDVSEIAAFSAAWASKKINLPVVVTDAGFYFEGLKGFPGPFIKYANQWFSSSDFIGLMRGRKNRKIIVKDCLAFCAPNKKPVVFCSQTEGSAAKKPGSRGISSVDQIFVPKGYAKTTSDMSTDEMLNFWQGKINNWMKLAKYLRKKAKLQIRNEKA